MLIAWPIVQNFQRYAPRWSRTRLVGLFPMLLGIQLILLGMLVDHPHSKPRDYLLWLLCSAGLVACWVYGQLLLAVIVFLLQLPYAFRLDNERRRTPSR